MGGAGGFQTTATQASLPPAEAEAEISLEEAFTGTTRLVDVDGKRLEIKIPRRRRHRQPDPARGQGRQQPRPVHRRPRSGRTRCSPGTVPTSRASLKVTLREALLGAEIPVGTLTGRVLLTLPSGTQNGRTFRLSGQGMPRLKGDGRGDLYVKVQVVLPTNLSDEAKAAGRTFLDLVEQPNPRGEA